jgi:threonylcarbamoyladenosine tRNA methylthiotransferase MtaB
MKFVFKTFGCKLNQYESELIRENLILAGLKEVEDLLSAQYLIVASCAVTQDSIKGMRKFISSARKKNPGIKVIILGCVVNLYPEEVKSIKPDLALDNIEKYNLPAVIGSKKIKFQNKISEFKSHHRAFVKIQDGCNNKCSYCCVWMARGKSRSRNRDQILEEIKILLSKGYKEIVVTGLCVGDYGKDIGSSLVDLLKEIEKLDNEFRIRISSIEPQDVGQELIDFLTCSEKTVPHLHIPLQSGSDRILKLMNRKYDTSYYKDVIKKLKKVSKKFQFSTDIIVGFPAEEERDFQSTITILRELSPVRVHIFPFSPRPKTPVFDFQPRVSCKIIWERKKRLQEEVRRIIRGNLENQIGANLTVLFERKKGGFWVGYSENYIPCFLKGEKDLNGEFQNVRVISVDKSNLACYVEILPT